MENLPENDQFPRNEQRTEKKKKKRELEDLVIQNIEAGENLKDDQPEEEVLMKGARNSGEEGESKKKKRVKGLKGDKIKGHGFVSFDNFASSDLAISQMNGQFFSGRQIKV